MKKSIFLFLLTGLSFFQIQAQCPNYSRTGIHVVQSGENLYRISKLYGVSLIELADWNNISTNTTLNTCQELAISNNGNREYHQPQEVFTDRAVEEYSYGNTVSNQKQNGNKHIIQQGETMRDLAQLYGYTEERFRKFNLLKEGEELSVGSQILSSDCACDRIVTYDELNAQNSNISYANYNNNTNTAYNSSENNSSGNNNSSYNNYGNKYNTGGNDNFQARGNDYDAFYDEPQGNTSYGDNPPPAQPIGNGQITSVSNPKSYDSGSNNNGNMTNASATYMSNEELKMLDEINLVRSNPTGYIRYIEQYKRDIQSGKSFGSSLAVCDELIAELRRTPRLSILKPVPCIYNAAKKHGLDQLSRGSTGHDGSDGSWPWDRVKQECVQMSDGNENLVGGLADVRESVILLLVDDGIPSRGHRKTMLGKDWVYGACYKIGKVGYMPNCWVQKYGR